MSDTETPRIVRAAKALQRLNSDTYIRRKFPQQLQDVAATINDMAHVGRVGNQRWRVGMFHSSAQPGQTVLVLAQDAQIDEWAKRSDFVEWVSP